MVSTERIDVYARVTAQIVQALADGVPPWRKPWTGADTSLPLPRRATGQPYRGINVLLLWAAMSDGGYHAPTWLTYRQALASGGQVRKGERGTAIVYAHRLVTADTDDTGEEHERTVAFLKGYTVFNVAQIDGLPQTLYGAPIAQPVDSTAPTDGVLEAFFARTGLTVQHGGDRASYSPRRDVIQLPSRDCFSSLAGYYGTLAHEAVHATGHTARLARDLSGRFGGNAYAMEELIAELGAAFLCAELSIATQVREDHAAYIGAWLAVLQSDTRAIFTAAAQAQRAVDFLTGRAACD